MAEIRKALLSDAQDICRLESLTSPTPWSRENVENALDAPGASFFMAFENGETAGYAGGSAASCELFNICVLERFRRHGIASRLLGAFVTDMKSRGAEEIFLEVRKSNAPAIGLYEKAGFRKIYERKRYYADNGETAVVMKKTL